MSLFSFFSWFLFLAPNFSWAESPKKTKFFVPQISIKMTLSGDMSNTYQFGGPLGQFLPGAPEKPDGPCENSSSFLQVIHQKKKKLQVWMRLKCKVDGQAFEFRPQRFFIDPSQARSTLSLPAQSEKFKKISVEFSEIQIKDAPAKK